MSETVNVEVVFALPAQQVLITLVVPRGTTALEAVRLSGIAERFPEHPLSPEQLKLGIFGKAVKPDTVLREHDRVEIYRPLLADPKEVRRQRALQGKEMKKGG